MKFKSVFIIAVTILVSTSAFAQFYGVNKVQYENFDWQYIQSEHFDVYFYEGGYDIARFTAEKYISI